VYFPATQAADDLLFVHIWFTPKWIVRTSGSSSGLIAGVTRAVEAVDPLLPFAGFETMSEVRGDAVRGHRFLVTLLGSLAALALLLAAVGIYGLIANSVTVRTRELGIRLALGATTPQVVRSVAAPALALALAGVAVGAGLSFPATTELKSLLYGIRSGDPITFAGVAVILLVVAGLASWLPAMRITRLNPAETLRHE
jgi:ABC-type antimicrobial peptide transport system permease subunit